MTGPRLVASNGLRFWIMAGHGGTLALRGMIMTTTCASALGGSSALVMRERGKNGGSGIIGEGRYGYLTSLRKRLSGVLVYMALGNWGFEHTAQRALELVYSSNCFVLIGYT